jgi:geranylgeranyl diphosphate synthase type II
MKEEFIQGLLEEINQRVAKLEYGSDPPDLYDPIAYIMEIGGKRMRPLLTLLSYRLFEDDYRPAFNPALAIEVFHNFTLMHDDIMDGAPLRRGKATVHEKWNDNTAILSGDVMLVKSYDLLLDAPPDKLKEVLCSFNRCAAMVCEGQQLDMVYETVENVQEDQYLEMIRRKTAVLLGYSLELGCLLAGAAEDARPLLRQFGELAGLGFQLKDDLLDVYADRKKFGKEPGGDIVANKKTYLLIKALELAEGKDREELKFWLSVKKFDRFKKVEKVRAIYDRYGIEDLTQARIKGYFNAGFGFFDQLKVNAERKKPLRNLMESLINREK